MSPNRDFSLGAENCVFEIDVQLDAQVGAAAARRPGPPRPTETTKAEEIPDDVGELLADGREAAGVFTATLNAQALLNYREKFPCHKDADGFTLV